ncbi:MAG TPA: zf-HC2 domain-containing protein [Candidatus Nanopelagicales bacterium]|nr:zf-HC2 domain-containing protein [Candidatus Nanopelagicales bacterium]
MSCLGARLDDLVDGRLSPELAEQALSHVAGCERCRTELTAQRRLRQLLATSSPPPGADALVSRLAGVAAVPAVAEPAPGTGPGRSARRVATMTTALVAVAVAGVGVAWSAGAGTPAPEPPLTGAVVVPAVDRFSAEHAACADLLPLAAPGSTIAQVGYSVRPAGAVPHRPR